MIPACQCCANSTEVLGQQHCGAGLVMVTKNVLVQVQLTWLMWYFYCTATMCSRSCFGCGVHEYSCAGRMFSVKENSGAPWL